MSNNCVPQTFGNGLFNSTGAILVLFILLLIITRTILV